MKFKPFIEKYAIPLVALLGGLCVALTLGGLCIALFGALCVGSRRGVGTGRGLLRGGGRLLAAAGGQSKQHYYKKGHRNHALFHICVLFPFEIIHSFLYTAVIVNLNLSFVKAIL